MHATVCQVARQFHMTLNHLMLIMILSALIQSHVFRRILILKSKKNSFFLQFWNEFFFRRGNSIQDEQKIFILFGEKNLISQNVVWDYSNFSAQHSVEWWFHSRKSYSFHENEQSFTRSPILWPIRVGYLVCLWELHYWASLNFFITLHFEFFSQYARKIKLLKWIKCGYLRIIHRIYTLCTTQEINLLFIRIMLIIKHQFSHFYHNFLCMCIKRYTFLTFWRSKTTHSTIF